MAFALFGEKRRQNEEQTVWEEAPNIVKPYLRIDEKPKRFAETLLFAWQHTLVDVSPFVLPLVVALACGFSAEVGAIWINRGLFTMGIATLIMTTFGNRLPIVQGPSATVTAAVSSVGSMLGPAAMWGGIFISSITEFFIGFLGLPGLLRKLFPITVCGTVITCIGFSLGRTAVTWTFGDGSPTNFLLAGLVIFSIFAFQFLGAKIHPILSRGSIAFSIVLVGIIFGAIIGRVDWALIANRPWFALPTFFPEGGPGFGWEFGIVAFIGVFVGILGSMVESIGDYAAVCAVSNEQYKVRHMNRGIMSEGLGCFVASIFGGIPVTSYTQNIGVISSTKIASRYVVQWAAILLSLYGLSPKFGAIIVAMPRSVLGAVFLVVCASISMSGIRLVASSKANTANAYVIGLTVLGAVLIPGHLASPAMAGFVGSLPQLLRLLLTNTTAFAVIFGIIVNQVANNLLRGKDAD